MNWRIITPFFTNHSYLFINLSIIAALILGFFLLYQRNPGKSRAIELPSNEVEYTINWRYYSGNAIFVLWGFSLIARGLLHYKPVNLNPYTIASFFILLLMLFDLSGSIFSSEEGLRQHYWFRKDKRIAWKDIEEINTGQMDRRVTIKAKNGTKIVHTSQYADRARLLREIRIHCGDELPEEFLKEVEESAVN